MTRIDHALRFLMLAAAVTMILVALAGCKSTTYRVGADGLKYHVGDRWGAVRLDKNYNPVRVDFGARRAPHH